MDCSLTDEQITEEIEPAVDFLRDTWQGSASGYASFKPNLTGEWHSINIVMGSTYRVCFPVKHLGVRI